jgi:hypothetical protein
MGKWMIAAGVVLILLGIAAQFGLLGWFGRLPGDIRIERPGFRFYMPLGTMLVVSIVLSLLLQLFRKFF